MNLLYPMFGVPNVWRRDDAGGLISYLETEEWRIAVGFIAETWKKGYWHPDGAGATSADVEPLFANGSVMMRNDNFVRYTVRGKLSFAVDLIKPFLAGGGAAPPFESPATDFLTFVKKGDRQAPRGIPASARPQVAIVLVTVGSTERLFVGGLQRAAREAREQH